MKFFIDTEFIERGREYPIELISLGVVAEDGRELYLVSDEFEAGHASDWVRANVLFQIWLDSSTIPTSVGQIAEQLSKFVGEGEPEFWGYYADYDWVVVCQMFGTMMDLPKGWPKYCRDLKQRCADLGNPTLPQQGPGGHNALSDARWNLQVYQFLERAGSKTSCGILGW